MMPLWFDEKVHCPYCGELIMLRIDSTIANQNYIEDCSVCCQPIEIQADFDLDDALNLVVKAQAE